MSLIFISHRRESGSAYAGRLYDRLADHFGETQIFMDVDNIRVGLDFVEQIEKAVQECDVLIVVIGKAWLTTKDEEGTRRLDNPSDFVRVEIQAGLGRNIPVVPLLMGGARMPKASELPDALAKLARRHAMKMSDERFRADMARLIEHISEYVSGAGSTGKLTSAPKRQPRSAPKSKSISVPKLKPASTPERKPAVPGGDEQRSHAGLLKAVFGRDFTPSPTELFPGTWRVRMNVSGLASATYDLDLRANGQITGTGKVDQGGWIGGILASEGKADLLNMQSSISGTWKYEEHTEILTLNLIAHGLGKEFHETIQIRTTGRELGEIRGRDFAGRDYVIKRVTAVREVRAALLELREAFARFRDADLDQAAFKHEIDIVVAACEAASPYLDALRSLGPHQPRKVYNFAK